MKKREKKSAGAPEWMVTYGDMMSLLLTFFVLLVSMSELKQEVRFKKVMESLRIAFGYKGGVGRVPTEQPPQTSLIKVLMNIQIPDEIKHIGQTQERGVEGKRPLVTEVRKTTTLALQGALQFERNRNVLVVGREQVLEDFAEIIRGLTNLIEIVGHISVDETPAAHGYADGDALAIARAEHIRDRLVALGIDPRRMRLISAAHHEPLVSQAYTEERRSRNRRVEIVVTSALVNEYDGEALSVDERIHHSAGRKPHAKASD